MIKVKVRTNNIEVFAVITTWRDGKELTGFQVKKEIDVFKFPDLITQELVALGYAFTGNGEKGTIFLTESKDVCLMWVGLKRGDDYQIKLLKRLSDIARMRGYFLIYGE